MTPTTKRKRNVLSIEDKVTIINRLEKGETGASLAKIFNVGKATISEIKARKSEILNFASKLDSTNGSKRRKTMKKASDEKLEDAVYLWFLQKRSLGEPISGSLLCEKALQLNQKLAGPSKFKASTGWLKNFKSRHSDAADPGHQILSEEEIVALVKTEERADINQDDSNDEEQEEAESEATHAEAFIAFETVIAWCKRQSECNSTDILLLNRMRDLAAKKRLSSMIQTKNSKLV